MPPFMAGFIVFATSAAVLVLEILAVRMLAPFVGVTLETFTAIIGVILAGIAFGAWTGGRAADRIDPRRLLGPLVTGGGVLALFTVPLTAFFGAALRGGGAVAVVLLPLLIFFAPAVLLSGVAPVVVKLRLQRLEETGGVVGRLSALGTAGALFGTFLTGFVLIRFFGSRSVVLAVGVLLVAGGAALWWWLVPRRSGAPSAVPLLVVSVVAAGLALATVGPCDAETRYFCARVVADEQRPSGRSLYLDTLRHSYVDLEDPTYLEFAYMQMFADVIDTFDPPGDPPGGPLTALHIGGAGFTMPRYLSATRPGTRNTVLEIDPGLVQLAQTRLALDLADPAIEVVVDDARMALPRLREGGFDVVIGDAFGGLAVPWHLTTREFAIEIRGVLRPGGLYVLNLIDYPPLDFVRAEVATLRTVFAHVAVVAAPGRVDGIDGGNFVLVASDAPLHERAIARSNAARGRGEAVVSGTDLEEFVGDAIVLTDDHAPVDQLLTPVH